MTRINPENITIKRNIGVPRGIVATSEALVLGAGISASLDYPHAAVALFAVALAIPVAEKVRRDMIRGLRE